MTIQDNNPDAILLHMKAEEAVSAKLGETVGEIGVTSEHYAQARKIATAAQSMSIPTSSALTEAESVLGNIEMYPEGRKVRATEALDRAEQAVQEAAKEAEARAIVLRAQLEQAVLAEPTGTAGQSARAEIQAILSVASDKVGALTALAKDPDPGIRALAGGSFGRRLSAALGAPADTAESLRQTALVAAAESGDVRATTAFKLRNVDSIIGAAASLQIGRIRSARTYAK